MRLILGTGESVMSPAYSKILSFHLPEHHRGFANGVLQAAVRSENLAALLSYVFDWLTGLIFFLLEKPSLRQILRGAIHSRSWARHSCEPSSLRYSALQKSGL